MKKNDIWSVNFANILSWNLVFFAILLNFNDIKAQERPVIVNFAVPPPYSPFLSDYENKIDEIIFNVTNISNNPLSLYFHGEIIRIEGGRVFTDPNYKPAIPFQLGPLESISLTASEIAGLNTAFSSNNLEVEGMDIEQIIAWGILPEGTYTICLRAYDFSTDLIRSVPGTGCSNPFVITHANPPRLNTPANKYAFCDPSGVLQFQWTPVIQVSGSQIEYDIEFIDLSSLGFEEEDALTPFVDGAPRFYTVENLMVPFYQYFIGMTDPPFEAGKKYAWRVRARDVNQVIFISDDGYSEVFTFHYNCEGLDPFDLNLKVVFPKKKDSIPYWFPYLAVEFEPYSDKYTRMVYDLEVRVKNGATVYSLHNSIPFGNNGPKARMNLHLPEAGKKRSSIHPLADVRDFQRLEKGLVYDWSATVIMEHPEGNLSAFTLNNEFYYGMRKPKLESPSQGEKVAPGKINFRFHSGKKPETIAPDSAMIQMPSIYPSPTFHRIESTAEETYVIEVYKNRNDADDPEKRIYHYEGVITGTIPAFDPIDKSAIENDLFRIINHESANEITEQDTFFWRVIYLKDKEKSKTEHYQKSKLGYFIVDPSISPDKDDKDSGDECGNDCETPEIADRSSRKSIALNDEIKVGKFTMKVKEITSSSGNVYNGKGVVELPFMVGIQLKVQFNNLIVNDAGEFYSGTVKGIEDPNTLRFKEIATATGTIKQLEDEDKDLFETFMLTEGRLLSMMTSGMEIGLPLGLDTDIDGVKFIVGIVDAEFEPREAKIQVVMHLRIPEIEEEGYEIPGFGAQLCINPNGFGPDKLLYMVGNLAIPFGNEEDMLLRFVGAPPGEGPDTNRICYVELDCSGFKAAQIALEVEFARSMIVPEDSEGNVLEAGRVKGFSRFKITGSDGWIAQFSMDKFQIAGLENWSFHVNDAYLDFSDNDNPPGFKFPKHYGDRTLSGSSDPAVMNRWQGFYLKNLTVHTPRGMSDDDENYRFNFGVKDVLIDKTGFSANFFAANVARYKEENEDDKEASISGWAISLDTISIVFTSNNFISGGISGKIGLPITEQTQYLKYKLVLEHNPTTNKFKFKGNVKPDGTLTIPMVIAELQLEQSSQLYFEIGSESKAGVKLTGNLNMSKDFSDEMANIPGDFEMPGLRFENLEIDTKDGFKGGTLADRSLDGLGLMGSSGGGGGSTRETSARSVGGFPLSIESINFNANGFNPVLSIEPRLSFSSDGEGLAMSSMLDFEFEYNTTDKSFGLNSLSVSAISVDLEFSVLTLKGRIEFYNRPHGAGIVEGFKGALEVKLPMGIEAKLAAEFGVFKIPETSQGFGDREFFGYFSLDVEVRGLNLTLMPALELTGLGGGFYHRMKQTNVAALSSATDLMTGSGSSGPVIPSGAQYVIDYETVFGLNFKAMFCFPNKCDLYSLDAGFGISFRQGGDLGHIEILGELYVMTDRTKNETPKVYAGVLLNFNNPPDGSSEFNGIFMINVAVGPQGRDPILRGVGRDCPPPPFPTPSFPCYTMINAHLFIPTVDTENRWFFHMGKPWPESARGGLELAIEGFLDISFSKYLMIGNEIPIELPPLPEKIENVLSNRYADTDLNAQNSKVLAMSNDRATPGLDMAKTGSGFAFGGSFGLDLRLTFAIFYAQLEFILGFDINLTNAPVLCMPTVGSGGEHFLRGKNGWYAQGQVYAYMAADFGIFVDLMFIKGEFSFLKVEAAMQLRGAFPNPDYFLGRAGLRYSILGGMVTGQCNFKVEIGEKCDPVAGNPFGDVPFIADFQPTGNNSGEGHSVFSNADIAFNWPVREVLPFPADPDDPEAGTRYIRIYPEYARIRNQSSNRIETARVRYAEDNYSLTIEPQSWLEAHAEYRIEILLRGVERNSRNASWVPIRYQDPVNPLIIITWTEDDEGDKIFRTGPRPRVIVEGNVHHTYPFPRQRYYLPGEGDPYLRQFQLTNELFASPYDGVDVKYTVRFRPVRGGDDIEVDLRPVGRVLLMNPSRPALLPETVYQVDFIREPDKSALDYQLEAIGHQLGHGQIHPALKVGLATVFEFRQLEGQRGDVTIEQRRVTAASIREDRQEILYTYHFRTSRYRTLAQKLWNIQYDVTGNFLHLGIGLLSRNDMPENFERYDLQGYSKNGTLRVPPLVRFKKPRNLSTTYHNRINLDYKTYDDYAAFAQTIFPTFHRSVAQSRLARNHRGIYINPGISPYQGNTVIANPRKLDQPLSDAESRGQIVYVSFYFWGPAPDHKIAITYQEAALVLNQTTNMKNRLQGLLNYNYFWSKPFTEHLKTNPLLQWRVNSFLARPVSYYQFNSGWYYFRARYLRPNPWAHPSRMLTDHSAITGSSKVWSFGYNR